MKIIINIRCIGTLFIDFEFIIFTFDTFGKTLQIKFGKSNGKKQYDGTYIFTIDISNIKCHEYIQVAKSFGLQNITLISLTVEFEESFQSIDEKSYKAAISNYIL